MDINDLLHLIVAAHEDTAAVVDMLRHDSKHTSHVAVNGLATSCLGVSKASPNGRYWTGETYPARKS